MTQHDPRLYLTHIIESIELAMSYVAGLIVWAVATQMLGPLKGQVASILDELGSGSETA